MMLGATRLDRVASTFLLADIASEDYTQKLRGATVLQP